MKSYFMLAGCDSAKFSNGTLLKLQRAMNHPDSFIGIDLSRKYALQMRPASNDGGEWSVELLNKEKLTLRWADMKRKKATALFRDALASSDPVKFAKEVARTWKPETLHLRPNAAALDPEQESDGT